MSAIWADLPDGHVHTADRYPECGCGCGRRINDMLCWGEPVWAIQGTIGGDRHWYIPDHLPEECER
jgi:hypothetical protein